MGLTASAEQNASRVDLDAGPYAHAVAMWRQYDCMTSAIGDVLLGETCRADDVERHAIELGEIMTRHGWLRAVTPTIGTQTIQRLPGEAQAALLGYNGAVRVALLRKRTPKV